MAMVMLDEASDRIESRNLGDADSLSARTWTVSSTAQNTQKLQRPQILHG